MARYESPQEEAERLKEIMELYNERRDDAFGRDDSSGISSSARSSGAPGARSSGARNLSTLSGLLGAVENPNYGNEEPTPRDIDWGPLVGLEPRRETLLQMR